MGFNSGFKGLKEEGRSMYMSFAHGTREPELIVVEPFLKFHVNKRHLAVGKVCARIKSLIHLRSLHRTHVC